MAETYTDPLALLDAPRPVHEPKPEPEMDTERLKAAFLKASEEIAGVAAAQAELAETSKAVVEVLPKVVQCYGCEEYAFDGCFTAYETDEGVQGFCPECVKDIERRSKTPERANVYVGDKVVGNVTSLDLDYGYSPSSFGSDGYRFDNRTFTLTGYVSPNFDFNAVASGSFLGTTLN